MKLSEHLLISTLFVLLITLCLSNSRLLAAETIEGSIDDLSRALVTYFPKVSGKITAFDKTQVEIDLNRVQGLASGVTLTVFRKEKPFHHPVTHVHMGHFEGEVGLIEVIEFTPPLLKAKRVDPTKEIEVGDLVRLSSTRIPLGIAMASEKSHPFLMHELSVALRDTGRFQVKTLAPGSDVSTALQAGNDYYLELTTSQHEEHFALKVQLQNTATAKRLAELTLFIRQSEESDLILEHLQYQLFEQRLKK